MSFIERLVLAFEPVRPYLVPFLGFDSFVSLALAIFITLVILRTRKRSQSIAFEMENLVRRYIIFRGHRQTLMKIHQSDEKVRHEILKAISTSWNHFKSMLEEHAQALRVTDRQARNFLVIVGALMAMNSFRGIAAGGTLGPGHWAAVVFLARELPLYLFLVTGFWLIRIQSHRLGKRHMASFNSELDAIFSDTERIQEALNDEFDPIDQTGYAEEP
jgi:hypothetical protein